MICKPDSSTRQPHRSVAAFTMVEIVLSLAVIAIAMVAIIGVLPLGMNVQSENRETSIINTDAGIWIEAIRGGAQGMEYLPNFVKEVRVDETRRNSSDGSVIDQSTEYITSFGSASNLIGILSYPKIRFEGTNDSVVVERYVYADVRALNGNMGDLIADNDFAFNYRMSPEMVPKVPFSNEPFQGIMRTNLFELRMNFAWPLVVGQGGDYRQQSRFSKDLTFRTLISGNHLIFPDPVDPNDASKNLYFVNPRHYGNQP